MASLTLDSVSVDVAGSRVLDAVDLTVPDGSFVVVLGASGSGKSTLLRTIAGLSAVASGSVRFGPDDVTTRPPADRDVSMVFQSPALLPKRNARRNVQFPLEVRREAVESMRQRVDAEVRAIHIEHLMLRRPDELARGEEQLVQIARALVRTPRVLLLDEPFAPLDHHLRHRIRSEIRTLQAGYEVTTVLATNDADDAFALSTVVVVLGPSAAGANTVLQVGTIRDVHLDPVSLTVATTTGQLWTMPVTVGGEGDGYWPTNRDVGLRLRAWMPALAGHRHGEVVVGFRSEDLTRADRGELPAVLERIVPGAPEGLMCRVGSHTVFARGVASAADIGTTIRLGVARSLLFDPRSGARIR